MTSNRSKKVSKLISKEIASIIQTELSDPRLGLINISEVKLSLDFKQASVYFSTIGHSSDIDYSVEDALNKASKLIRHTLGQRVKMKYLPALTFYYDDLPEQYEKIDALLDTIEPNRYENPESEPLLTS